MNAEVTPLPGIGTLQDFMIRSGRRIGVITYRWWAAKRQGIAKMGRARAGAALVARGEFSIVIAGLTVASGAVDEKLAALATAYVLLMAVLGPVAARIVEPVVGLVRKRRGARETATA